QGVQRELERQVSAADRIVAADRRRGAGVLQPQARMLVPPAPADATVDAELAMRTGADAQVVAEAPVIEIVPAGMAGQGVGGGLVMPVAGRGQSLLAGLHHREGQVVVRQRRWPGGELGVWLQGELVM